MATMEELVQTAVKQAALQKKPQELLPWKPDEPWPQPLYSWDADAEIWQPLKPPTRPANSLDQAPQPLTLGSSITTIALYSWNIDFMLPLAEARMTAALAHLGDMTRQPLASTTTAVVVNLQECTPSDLVTISQARWVRERFLLTDLDSSAWASAMYGTTTLVDRRLGVASCARVHYAATQMERDALLTDVVLPGPGPPGGRTVRLGNTHLESLALDPPLRPAQVRAAARYLRAAEGEGLAGAVLAGDFNAIQPSDATAHSDNGLRDAYLELGGREGAGQGHTWGQQALPSLRERFGCSRMDKALLSGDRVRLLKFERFGADVEVEGGSGSARQRLLSLGFEKAWVTDHLGIHIVFSITNDTRL